MLNIEGEKKNLNIQTQDSFRLWLLIFISYQLSFGKHFVNTEQQSFFFLFLFVCNFLFCFVRMKKVDALPTVFWSFSYKWVMKKVLLSYWATVRTAAIIQLVGDGEQGRAEKVQISAESSLMSVSSREMAHTPRTIDLSEITETVNQSQGVARQAVLLQRLLSTIDLTWTDTFP